MCCIDHLNSHAKAEAGSNFLNVRCVPEAEVNLGIFNDRYRESRSWDSALAEAVKSLIYLNLERLLTGSSCLIPNLGLLLSQH